ncbi:MAG: rhodanese-like domain-containing protein [Candidatus Eremiobacteraeota bacterium]|nr:rhodanese-like domain-containing protein [Candidatus Eremiobacteraeota bacterium]
MLLKQLCLLLALSTLAGAQTYPDISAQELLRLKGKVTILDCNGTDSYQQEHIPGAIDYLGGYLHLKSLLPRDKKALIVAYCGGSRCPMYKLGADDARRLGYTNIRHLASGLQGWKELGYPITH